MGVEFLARRVELSHAMALEGLGELTLGELDALDQAGKPALRLARLARHRLERPPKIVGDGKHIAGESRNRIGTGVGYFLLGAPAQILHFRESAKELVLEVRLFLLEF